MNKLELLEKALKLFSGWKNKAFSAIGKELNEAFSNEVLIQYDRFKHWFVKEDPTAAAVWKKYEEKPEANEVVVKSIAEDKLAADPAFADTLQRDLVALEAKYYNVVNYIGTIEGDENEINQSGNANTHNTVELVKGKGNTIIQGSNRTGDL